MEIILSLIGLHPERQDPSITSCVSGLTDCHSGSDFKQVSSKRHLKWKKNEETIHFNLNDIKVYTSM